MRLLFERDLTPHPQYAAFYKWLQQDFGASAVLHMGMHGTGALRGPRGAAGGPGPHAMNAVLCCAVLCCAVLCCAVLCCVCVCVCAPHAASCTALCCAPCSGVAAGRTAGQHRLLLV